MIHYVTPHQLERAQMCIAVNAVGFFTADEIAIAELLRNRQPVHALTERGLYYIRIGSQEYPEEMMAVYIKPSEAGHKFHRFKTVGPTPQIITIHEHAILSPLTNEASQPQK